MFFAFLSGDIFGVTEYEPFCIVGTIFEEISIKTRTEISLLDKMVTLKRENRC